MKDNNEGNIDETLDNGEVKAQEAEAGLPEDDGITEETVSDTDDAFDTESAVSEEEQTGEDGLSDGADESDGIEEDDLSDEEEEEYTESHVTRIPADRSSGIVGWFASLNKKQLGCVAVLAVVIVAVIVTIIVLATSGRRKNNAVSVTPVTVATTAATQATSEQATTMPVVVPETEVSLESLQQENEDVYAYIYVPGTNISYPILQSESRGENYYLSYTINHYASWTGAIYTQFTYNKKDFSDNNTIIYGHAATSNINSVMFTQLHMYESEEFLNMYPYVYIYEGDRQLKYQIFAAVHFTDVLIPTKYGVNDGEALVQFVQDAKTTYGGVIDDSVVIDKDSKIVTLSTCTMKPNYDDNKRFLVLAKLVEEAIVQK